MATRLYLPSSGTSPLPSLAVAGDWECLHHHADVEVSYRPRRNWLG